MKLTLFLVFSLQLCPILATAGTLRTSAPKPVRPILTEELDQKSIHDLYNNGEFETVIDVLERFQKNNPTCSFSDSVFIAKHLAVVYTATPATREKGRFYMMRLLELVPTAKLIDMFVSDEIDRIFERVREEFIAKRRGFGLDTLVVDASPRRLRESPDTNKSGNNKPSSGWGDSKYWVLGAAATFAIGVSAYIYLKHEESDPTPRELVVAKPGDTK